MSYCLPISKNILNPIFLKSASLHEVVKAAKSGRYGMCQCPQLSPIPQSLAFFLLPVSPSLLLCPIPHFLSNISPTSAFPWIPPPSTFLASSSPRFALLCPPLLPLPPISRNLTDCCSLAVKSSYRTRPKGVMDPSPLSPSLATQMGRLGGRTEQGYISAAIKGFLLYIITSPNP